MQESEMIIEVVNEPCLDGNEAVMMQRTVSCCGNEWNLCFSGD